MQLEAEFDVMGNGVAGLNGVLYMNGGSCKAGDPVNFASDDEFGFVDQIQVNPMGIVAPINKIGHIYVGVLKKFLFNLC